MIVWFHIIYTSISAIYKNVHTIEKKTMETKIIQNIFNKNGRCKDVKTQKVCEQVRKVNVEPKIKETSFI